ncbi:MAG: hypothetical protein JW729_06820 [Bacteroidales bacterium]|nr:hypothetical protein [Bacteroidales bacterium]
MSIDLLIMSYALLMVLLIFMSEKLPQFSLRIVLIGLFFSPIIGFISYFYFQKA